MSSGGIDGASEWFQLEPHLLRNIMRVISTTLWEPPESPLIGSRLKLAAALNHLKSYIAMPTSTALDPQAVRTQNGVTLVSSEHEGLSRKRLPAGTYGFTGAPGEADGGLYSKHIYLTFEVHKLKDSSIQLLGYVTPQEAEMVQTGLQTVDLNFYPVPYKAADTLLPLPWSRIRRAQPVSRIDGNFVPVTIAPLP